MNKLKKTSCFLTSLILCLGLCGCNSDEKNSSKVESIVETTEQETTEAVTDNIEEYKLKIKEFSNTTYEASLLLNNAGKFEGNYWKQLNKFGGTIDFDDVYEKAINWLIENADAEYNVTKTKFNDDYKVICTNYSDITGLGVDSTEVSAINEAFEELFKSYCNLYILITEPSGNLSNFIDNTNTYINSIKNTTTLLDTLLE